MSFRKEEALGLFCRCPESYRPDPQTAAGTELDMTELCYWQVWDPAFTLPPRGSQLGGSQLDQIVEFAIRAAAWFATIHLITSA